jgi:hypothetical protein
MLGNIVIKKTIPIYNEDRGWVINVYKYRTLYSVQCSDGNLTQEEIEAINSIVFDASFEIKLQKFVDGLDNTQQTKKADGLTLGVFCSMSGIKTRDVAEHLVSLLEQEVYSKRVYIAQRV